MLSLNDAVVLDVRSPGEFHQGHLPSAHNLPLLSDTERAQVGTLYKQVGHEPALLRALEFAGVKMRALVESAMAAAPEKKVHIYCFRGGMRSKSVAWLLETAGFTVSTLAGGYKAFRRRVHEQFATPRTFHVLGGATGTGKTEILKELSVHGISVIDLEHLAHHRGSSYGALGFSPQPTQEHFENQLAYALALCNNKPIWIEDENRMIGACKIPDPLYAQIQAAPLTFIQAPTSDRVERLVQQYGAHPKTALVQATTQIGRRLGDARMRAAVRHIEAGNLPLATETILHYYDRAYQHALERRTGPVYTLDKALRTPADWAAALLQIYDRSF